jgi:acetyl esterase/lipase
VSRTEERTTPVQVLEPLDLWPAGVPDPVLDPYAEQEVTDGDSVIVRNVSRPTLTPYLPHPSNATGTAVVVAPGGGFHFLAWDYEGVMVAEHLAAQGVAAFLLKYRVADTGPTEERYRVVMGELMQRLLSEALAGGVDMDMSGAVQHRATADAIEAVRLVRQRSALWGVQQDRVGFLGFSAGAFLATEIAVHPDSDARPAFAAAIYGGKPPSVVPEDAPPLFAALAADDLLVRRAAVDTARAWMEAGRPVELHLFEQGGHGFGMRSLGLPSDRWTDHLGAWMQSRGLLPERDATC